MDSYQSTGRGRTTSSRGRFSHRGRHSIANVEYSSPNDIASSPSSVNSIQPTIPYHTTLSSPTDFTTDMLTEPPPPPPPPPSTHIPHPPSTQGPPLDTQGATGSSSQNIGVVPPQNSLILIRPASTSLFDPFDVTRKISEIIKTKYERAITQWSDFYPEEKECYFKEFKSKFTWDPAHDVAIKKLWNKKSGELFRGMMHRARENPTKAVWIPTAVLSELQRIWDGQEYKKKREQGKKNRASEDSCSHTGGSIPHTEYRKRMKVELGRDPTKAEVFVRTHQKKSTQQLVDERAKNTIEKFNKLKEDILTQRSVSSTTESPLESLDEDPLFLTATGGKNKKNRIYGLGSEASFMPSIASSCSSGHSRLYTQAELEQELEERIARMNSELLDEVGDLRQRMQDQERMVQQLFSHMQMRSPRNNPDDDHASRGHQSGED